MGADTSGTAIAVRVAYQNLKVMSIQKIVTGFARLRDEELDTFTQNILNKMTGNANFTTPVPALADIETSLKDYQSALAQAKGGSKEQTSLKRDKRQALEALLRDLAAFVQVAGKNNGTVMLSSGFDLRKASAPIGILAKPVAVKIVPGPNPGSIRISVERIVGADSYIFQYVEAPATAASAWQTKAATARSITIDNLTIGKEYAFRIGAVGSDPTIVYSEVLTKFIA